MAFNWDSLDIGNVELEHSQNFFDFRHIEHERLGEQNDEFAYKIVPRSKPIAIFKGKRLFRSDEFQTYNEQHKDENKKVEVKQPTTKMVPEPKHVVAKGKSKPIVPVNKKMPLSSKPVRAPTIPRQSRVAQYAETYAEKRKAMIERYKKEQEEKNKSKRFRARSLPKYLKARMAQKRSPNEENKENVREEQEPCQELNHGSKLPDKRLKLRKSRSALELNRF